MDLAPGQHVQVPKPPRIDMPKVTRKVGIGRGLTDEGSGSVTPLTHFREFLPAKTILVAVIFFYIFSVRNCYKLIITGI